MILEWECILDCNYKCEYCVNSRNSALETPINYETDKEKVFNFIHDLKKQYPNEELFLFGGEPFLHPFIDEIIRKLNEVEMRFVIQTNGQLTNIIKNINEPFEIQVSVHPTQINEKYIENLKTIKDKIRKIDIMYVGEESLNCFKKLLEYNTFIVPVAKFLNAPFGNEALFEFNKLKHGIHSKVYNFEQGERSLLWEQQMRGEWSPKYKPCAYKDIYVLFDPLLNKYNCSYRQNNEVCPNDHCFMM